MAIFTYHQLSETFDSYKDSWDNIEITASKDGNSCYINRKNFKNIFIKNIKLSDNPKVNIFCSWDFHQSSITGKFIPRPTFYKLKDTGEIQETDKEKVKIDITKTELPVKFWEMISFFQGYKELVDVGEFENKYKVISKDKFIIEFNKYQKAEQIKTLCEFIGDNDLSYNDLKNLLNNSKHNSLQTFQNMLNNDNLKESDWQKFFEANMWIFAGISLKLIFSKGNIGQADVGIANTTGGGSSIVDFLLIDDYTSLVELKTPNTKIFSEYKRSTARANTWSFSNDFIDGISQCLGQKDDLIKNAKNKEFTTKDRNIYHTEAQDPQCFFIIGNKCKEFPFVDTNIDHKKKSETLERYRRNSKNITIITYDELYKRAEFIVNNRI